MFDVVQKAGGARPGRQRVAGPTSWGSSTHHPPPTNHPSTHPPTHPLPTHLHNVCLMLHIKLEELDVEGNILPALPGGAIHPSIHPPPTNHPSTHPLPTHPLPTHHPAYLHNVCLMSFRKLEELDVEGNVLPALPAVGHPSHPPLTIHPPTHPLTPHPPSRLPT